MEDYWHGQRICPYCQGNGIYNNDVCFNCKGTGKVPNNDYNPERFW